MTIEQAVRLALPADEVEPKLSELQRLGIDLHAAADAVWQSLTDAASAIMEWLRDQFAVAFERLRDLLPMLTRWLHLPQSRPALRLAEMRATVGLRSRQRAAMKRRRR